MLDEELYRRWPEVAIVAADMRRIGKLDVAEKLVDAARGKLGASDIIGSVGIVLRNHTVLREQLSEKAVFAWDIIMIDVSRAFSKSRFAQWLASLTG